MGYDAAELSHALGGSYNGRQGRAPCPVCQYAGHGNPSLSIGTGKNGAPLLMCFKGCSYPVVAEELAVRGLASTYRPARNTSELRNRDTAIASKKRREQAERCWNETVEIHGTAAEAYLRGRGITCEIPDTLRFHPDCWHPTGKRFPAMVACINGSDCFAIHRTYLHHSGRGKAPVEPARAMLGQTIGGAVRLTDGGDRLLVGEGIETVLSVLSVLSYGPVAAWAALSTSGLRRLRLPTSPGHLSIACDGDVPGRSAAHDLAERAHALGWTVGILDPGEGRDFNDNLRMGVAV